MALHRLQSALARLSTDRAFRQQFFADPDAVCATLELSATERAMLEGLRREEVERYARSLRSKRWGQVRALVPALARLLSDDLRRQFEAFCDDHPSAGDPLEETAAFLAMTNTASPFSDDLLRCEQLRIEVLREAHRLRLAADHATIPVSDDEFLRQPWRLIHARVAEFNLDWSQLYPLVRMGKVLESEREPAWLLIGKVPGELRVKLRRIQSATAQVLLGCNGAQPADDALAGVMASLRLSPDQRAQFRAEGVTLLRQLTRSGLLARA